MGDVTIAYVYSGGAVEHSWAISMLELLAHDGRHRQVIHPDIIRQYHGAGGLPNARNGITRWWLDQVDTEWLWQIDTDMGFLPDTVDRLLDAADPVQRPVVGALCFGLRPIADDGYQGHAVQPHPTLYRWDGNGFLIQPAYPRDELIQASGTGAACLLVHRGAAEKLRAEYGDDWWAPVRYPDGRFLGEDLSFCYRLLQQRIPLHVHTGVRTTHAKTVWVGEQHYLDHLVGGDG